MNYIKLLKENKKYFEDFITRSTYNSNSIEGSTLTYAQTYAIIFNDNSFTINNVQPREIYEAINHKYALNYLIDTMLNKGNLEASDIIEMNALINKNILDVRGYRKVDVMIRGAKDLPPSANEVPTRMMYYIDNYNAYPMKDIDEIFYKLAKFHIDFERIHPFQDGNGRTGRLLLQYELLKNNMAPIIIPIERRDIYFSFIANNDEEGMKKLFMELSEDEKERANKFLNIK